MIKHYIELLVPVVFRWTISRPPGESMLQALIKLHAFNCVIKYQLLVYQDTAFLSRIII